MKKPKETAAGKKNVQIILESARNLLPRMDNSSMPSEEPVIKKVDEPAEESQKKSPRTYKEFYAVNYPYGYVRIQDDKETGKHQYLTIEPTMTEQEEQALAHLKIILKEETNVPLAVLKDATLIEQYLNDKIERAIKAFKLKITSDSVGKFVYYIKRDFLGYGILDIPMRDQNIEDISCNGTGIPIYVWHRYYESVPTNIRYRTKEELDAFITRLAYRAGHQISVSRPILEGTLPEGFRVHLTLEEVSKRGNTFTIRKIKANPFTIIDLINFGTVSPSMAAYFWILVENLRSIIVAGATASGKTALLNSIAMFIRPEMKVVTIEEIRELYLHENWIPMVTRPSFQPGVQEVTLFDLLKSSLRQRPDYIVVGEIRGEEAYTLFQSISVGHGGLCTIHAEGVETVEKRLLTKPMDIPPMLIPMMNVIVLIGRTKIGEATVRRVLDISEITGIDDQTERATFKKIFEWDPNSDSFVFVAESADQSYIFKRITELKHVSMAFLLDEMNRREHVLKWMANKNIQSYDQVADMVRKYYTDPNEVYNRARLENQ
jgi:flagellar protein FlaI